MASKPFALSLTLRQLPGSDDVDGDLEVQVRELLCVSSELMRLQRRATRLGEIQSAVDRTRRQQFNWAREIEIDIADELYLAIDKIHRAVWGRIALALLLNGVDVRLERPAAG
jgi:hypothetical protein